MILVDVSRLVGAYISYVMVHYEVSSRLREPSKYSGYKARDAHVCSHCVKKQKILLREGYC